MKTTLNTSDIANALKSDENANWSWDGSRSLAEYLEQIEEDTGEEMELDVVAIRCDFSEYDSLQAWICQYQGQPFEDAIRSAGIDLDGEESEEEIDALIRSFIEDHGTLIEFSGGIIVSSF